MRWAVLAQKDRDGEGESIEEKIKAMFLEMWHHLQVSPISNEQTRIWPWKLAWGTGGERSIFMQVGRLMIMHSLCG